MGNGIVNITILWNQKCLGVIVWHMTVSNDSYFERKVSFFFSLKVMQRKMKWKLHFPLAPLIRPLLFFHLNPFFCDIHLWKKCTAITFCKKALTTSFQKKMKRQLNHRREEGGAAITFPLKGPRARCRDGVKVFLGGWVGLGKCFMWTAAAAAAVANRVAN